MAITDKTAIQNYLLIDIDSQFNSQIDEWIQGVYEYMCNATNRQLLADEDESACLYDGNNKNSLLVDDFVSISKVEWKYQGGSDFQDITDDTFSYPANRTPKYKIETTWAFPRGRQNVRITGLRGYTTQDKLPMDLKLAATILVAGIINYSSNVSKEVKTESIGRYTVTYDTEEDKKDYATAMETLKNYTRIR